MSINEYDLYDRGEPALSGLERDLYDAVDADEPWALVERFAELERVSGSADERRAAEYVEERLSALGIEYDRYDPELWLSIPHDASLSVTGPVAESFDAVKTVSFAKSGSVEGELVRLGGDDSDEDDTGDDGVDDLLAADLGDPDADVAGKVAVVEGLLPIEAIGDLEDRGAAAVVAVHAHDREPHDGIATPVWGAVPHPDRTDRVPDLPVVTVARPVGDRLLELLGAADTAGSDAPTVAVETDLTRDWFECPVVVAEIEGEADPDDEDFVLLHGHYDSWHVGVADNATGDAALLELARVFHEHRDRLRRDLRVAWWPGHSTGRYAGSTWYADTVATELVEHCVAQVDVDSPGAADATAFGGMTCWMPEADALCTGAIDDVAGKDAPRNRPPRAGDYSFDNLGVTGLFMLSSEIPEPVREARGYHPVGGCGGNADAWHLTTDTLDKADPDVLVRDVRVYATAVARLLADEVLPLDHRETVAAHREAVAEYDAAAGDHFDLSPVLDELDRLGDALDGFYDAVEDGAVAPAAANDAIRRLSRRLVRLGFAREGQFDHDPAVPRPSYPRLAPAADLPDESGDSYRFRRWHLRRARNEAVHELRRAREVVEGV